MTSASPADTANDLASPEIEYRMSSLIAVLSDPHGIQAETFGALRTYLLAKHIGDGRRSLALCSPAEGAGVTYVSANLAVALAQAGVNTLLIDGNMRSPGLEEYIQPSAEGRGLKHCLAGECLLQEAVHSNVIPHLSLLYSGGITDNAQELLAGKRLAPLIDASMRDYDITIVDTPPGNSCADARRIATILRYALVIARRDVTYVADVKEQIRELQAERATVIGSFLNDY